MSAGEADLESRKEGLLTEWSEGPLDLDRRGALLQQLRELDLFPRLMTANDAWEADGGLYPDLDDPRFTEKLMMKLEFAESKQPSIQDQMDAGVNPCEAAEFELTPVQRFISRFLSPQCPYQSALLFHGVGVGKTCAAVTVAENYLRSYPRRSVFIVAPRTIQSGFRKTIFNFDENALVIPDDEETPNTQKGCTGNTYLKRGGLEYERDRRVIKYRVEEAIRARYTILGYVQFQRYIEAVMSKARRGLEGEELKAEQTRLLRKEFSGRLVIIDEAHNLRDTPAEAAGAAAAAGDDEEAEEDVDAAGGDTEVSSAKAGKRLTPALLRVLEAAEGMKLILATATPMYNSYKEITFLLNMLLINDKRDKRIALSESMIFQPNGAFRRAGANGQPGGEEILGSVASAYVSFMRGENPLAFPIRLPPEGTPVLKAWPARDPVGAAVKEEETARVLRLPLVPVTFDEASAATYAQISSDAIESGGLGVNSIDEMVQAGNWLFPGEEGIQTRDTGFNMCFKDSAEGTSAASTFSARDGDASWLLAEALGGVSPKAKFVLERLRTAKGISFVYSRFIKSGALPLALALEANGYTLWGGRKPLLENGPQGGKGRQCAMCPRREMEHAGAGHSFKPAYYIIITGKGNISAKNPAAIDAARAESNKDGSQIKVILGSSVASEGVDFRFVREIYMFDSWFHLNKMEQVLGRGVRFCSHSKLPKEQRNCTIHLMVNTFAGGEDTETADLYMYRLAMSKALQVGRVTRVLKQYALDCNINKQAVLITGLRKQRHVDSQGVERPQVDVNDMPFTSMCDWIECAYDCAKPVEIPEEGLDTGSYDEHAVRWRETALKGAIRRLFERKRQPAFQLETIAEAFKGVPMPALASLLAEIVGNRSFHVTVRGIQGYIVYRNGYYLFQPDYVADVRAPLALRFADIPVRRDMYEPVEVAGAAAAVAAGPAGAAGAAPAAGEAAAAAAAVPAAGPPDGTALEQYWGAITQWAAAIQEETARMDDLPAEVKAAIDARYEGDERTRESERLIMINWLYEHIATEDYAADRKAEYLKGLATALLEFIWDESLRPNEQQILLQNGEDLLVQRLAKEQLVQSGTRRAFRYVDILTGKLKYICDGAVCSEAIRRVFDTDAADPLNRLQANTGTAGRMYGFIVPKGKEGRLVFKTSDAPPPPGGKVEKGKECAIDSTIAHHIKMLKEIADMIVGLGYPRFILTEEILDEKARRVAEKKTAKASGKKSAAGGVTAARNPLRSFENAIRACALKNVILRWLDGMEETRARRAGAGGAAATARRYFFRPIASAKVGHKGTVTKE